MQQKNRNNKSATKLNEMCWKKSISLFIVRISSKIYPCKLCGIDHKYPKPQDSWNWFAYKNVRASNVKSITIDQKLCDILTGAVRSAILCMLRCAIKPDTRKIAWCIPKNHEMCKVSHRTTTKNALRMSPDMPQRVCRTPNKTH